ncbi:MAG: MerR family transcriptional regulator [Rhodospirillales bacterium]|nr:MerR family transcriptional regulator [Rhodospirillales bacterium]
MAATADSPSTPGRVAKSAVAFRTISEVASELDIAQHVLRFWESKFIAIKPMKRGGGRRYYRPEDVALLKRIRDLLYTDGYTIKGVQKLFREGGGRVSEAKAETPRPSAEKSATPVAVEAGAPASAFKAELESIVTELEDIRSLL